MTEKQLLIKYKNRLWYYNTYNNLINKCKLMKEADYGDSVYTEKHHILPKCIGGTDDDFNLVIMPVRYHIVAHMLLAKIYPDNGKLHHAVHLMLTGDRNKKINKHISTRLVAKFKERKSYFTRGKYHPNYGKHLSKETRDKISKSVSGERNGMYGKHPSKETLIKKSKAMTGKKLPPRSIETKQKISAANTGKFPTIETKIKLSKRSARRRVVIDPKGNIFQSIAECAKFYGVQDTTISFWAKYRPEKGFKSINNRDWDKLSEEEKQVYYKNK